MIKHGYRVCSGRDHSGAGLVSVWQDVNCQACLARGAPTNKAVAERLEVMRKKWRGGVEVGPHPKAGHVVQDSSGAVVGVYDQEGRIQTSGIVKVQSKLPY